MAEPVKKVTYLTNSKSEFQIYDIGLQSKTSDWISSYVQHFQLRFTLLKN